MLLMDFSLTLNAMSFGPTSSSDTSLSRVGGFTNYPLQAPQPVWPETVLWEAATLVPLPMELSLVLPSMVQQRGVQPLGVQQWSV